MSEATQQVVYSTAKKSSERFNYPVSFNLDSERKEKLEKSMWFLKVEGKRQSTKMRLFIDKLYTYLMNTGSLTTEIEFLKEENTNLKKDIERNRSYAGHLEAFNKVLQLELKACRKKQTETAIRTEKSEPVIIEPPKPKPKPEPATTQPIQEEPKRPAIEPPPQRQTPTIRKEGLPDFITCHRDRKAYPPMELPCIKDINFKCTDQLCHKSILEVIGFK